MGGGSQVADQNARQDQNQFPALIAHSGTAGTAETVRVVATAAGAITFDQVETTGFNGGTVAVGTAPIELTFTGVTQGVMITADHANGTMVYIGGSAVSQTGSAAITSLWPGESLSMDLNDASSPIYAVGGTAGQKIYKAGLT